MQRAPLALVLVASMLVVGVAQAGAPPRAARAPAAAAGRQITEIPRLQAEAFAAINELRRSRGLGELRLNRVLSQAALGHSVSMANHGFFAHSGSDGSSFWQRIKPRYPPLPHAYWSVGENIIWASPDLRAEQALEMWLKSPPHRKILLRPVWREIGLGAVHVLSAPGVFQGLDVTILTADFGVR